MKNDIPSLYPFSKRNPEVIFRSVHSETEEELVVYRKEYDDHGLWVRPLGMFLEHVEVEGKTVPRFEYLGSGPSGGNGVTTLSNGS
jgi:hypothetical protein